MRKFAIPLVSMVVAVGLIFAGCAAPAPAPAPAPDEPVVDKWVFPSGLFITGTFAYFGNELIFGTELAVEKVNAAGGIRGKPVEVVWYDMGSDDAAKAVVEIMSLYLSI